MAAPTRKLSNAVKSIGAYIEIDNGDSPLTFSALGDVNNASPSGAKFDEVDTTHLLSPADAQGNIWKELMFNLVDGGTCPVEINFTMQDNQDKLIAAQGKRKTFNINMPQLIVPTTYPAGLKLTFAALVNTVVPQFDIKGVIKAKCELRVTGAMTYSALS